MSSVQDVFFGKKNFSLSFQLYRFVHQLKLDNGQHPSNTREASITVEEEDVREFLRQFVEYNKKITREQADKLFFTIYLLTHILDTNF